MAEWKANVLRRFDAAADDYARYSDVQQKVADRLMAAYMPARAPRRILEVGCGDGYLTSLLAARYQDSHITALDLSPCMIGKARIKMQGRHSNTNFHIMDGEALSLDGSYDLIISSMTAQWFTDVPRTYKSWQALLDDNGHIVSARPAADNFPEWRTAVEACGFESGLVPFQDSAIATIVEKMVLPCDYPDTLAFLKSMKKTGAMTARADYRPLTASALRQICAACDAISGGRLSWHVIIETLAAR